MIWPAAFAARAALTAGALLLALGLLSPVRAQTAPQAWTNDQSMFLFYQAFLNIQQEALNKQSGGEIVRGALKAYLESLGPYSTYLTPQEYRAHKSAGRPEYSGVGMDVYRESPSRLVCLPHPGSPARRAGMNTGDLLISVDNKPVSGFSLLAVGNMVRGPTGSNVALGLRSPQGKERRVSVKRQRVQNMAVIPRRLPGVLLLRVLRFDSGTVGLLRQALGQAKPGDKVVIDLRSCRGGSLYAGVEAADMLLAKGKPIVTLVRRGERKAYASRQLPLTIAGPLFLWQDRYTASSAELFIAALVQNHVARSVGTRSFGKASTQKVLPLSDGSALVLTDGKLLGPDGKTWNGQGLTPSLPLSGPNPGLAQYLARIKAPAAAVAAKPPTAAQPPALQAQARLLTRVATPGPASDKRFYVCFVDPYPSREAARKQGDRFAADTPPDLAFTPVESELLSLVKGRFFSCLPPQFTRGQAVEHQRVLDHRNISVLGILEGPAPPAPRAAAPPEPNPEDWFIQVNRFSYRDNALKEARRLAAQGFRVMIAVTILHPKHQHSTRDWLRDNRLAGEIYLCPSTASGCDTGYAVLAGPYFAKTEEIKDQLKPRWPGALWVRRQDLARRY